MMTDDKTMTRAEFKARWESDDDGGGITFDDIATCAVSWGLYARPKVQPIETVMRAVLNAAGVVEALGEPEDEQARRLTR
jgi:hypothetical protein